jgi:hypothetical protein
MIITLIKKIFNSLALQSLSYYPLFLLSASQSDLINIANIKLTPLAHYLGDLS